MKNKVNLRLWHLLAGAGGLTVLVAAIAVAVTLFVGRSSSDDTPGNDLFAEVESSEMLETNSVEESTPEPEQEQEPVSTEDEQSSEVETTEVSNTTDEKSSDVRGTTDSETIVPSKPSQTTTERPSQSQQEQTTSRPSTNQSVQTQPSNAKPSTSQPANTQQSNNQQTQTQPSQPTQPEQTNQQNLVPLGVSIAQTDGGKATANGQPATVIWKGMTVVLVAEPKEGFEFDTWYVNGMPYSNMNPALIQPQTSIGVMPLYKKVPPSNNNSSNNSNSSSSDQQKPDQKKEYTVNMQQTEGGSATVDGKTEKSFKDGQTATLKAKANKGFVFDGWEVNGNLVSKENPCKYKVTGNATVTPIFKEVYRLRVAVENAGGTLKVTENDEILLKEIHNFQYTDIVEGRKVVVTANPFEGNAVKCWIVDGKEISSTSNTYTFTGSADIDVVAVFEETASVKSFTVDVTKAGSGEGTVTINGETVTKKEVPKGTKLTLNTNPDEGSVFKEYLVNGARVTSNPYVFEVTGNCNIVTVIDKAPVEQEMATLEVTTDGTGEGYILINNIRQNKVTLPINSEVELEGIAREGSEFSAWDNGSKTNPRTIKLTSNMSLVATFEKTSVKPEETATVKLVVKTGKGTVAMNGKTGTSWKVEKGTSVSFVPNAADGYQFGGFTSAKVMDNPYTTTVNDDLEIEVYFDELATITLNAQEGGHVESDGKTVSKLTVVKGSEIPVSAVVDDEKIWRFIGWDGDTEYFKGTSASGTVTADRNITLTAKFAKRNEYTLTVVLMGGGDGEVTLDGEKLQFVSGTATKKVTASTYEMVSTPKDGYRFGSYRNSNGTVLGTNATRNVTIANDTTIQVEFVAEATRKIDYLVRGNNPYFTDYVAPGQAPESFYSTGLDSMDNDEFKGWVLENKLYEGTASSGEFTYTAEDGTTENLTDAIKRITQNSDVTLVARLVAKEVYRKLSYQDPIEIVGDYADTSKEVDGTVCYRQGSYVTVRIRSDYTNSEKPYFSHWEVTGINGKAGQDRDGVTFKIDQDTTVTAVWSSVEVDKEPTTWLTTGSIIPNMGISDVYVNWNIPGGYSVNQAGILISSDESATMEYGNSSLRVHSRSASNPNAQTSYESWAGIGMKDEMAAGANNVRVRPYIVVVVDGSERYVYGSPATFDFSEYKAARARKIETATVNLSSEGDGHVLVDGEEVSEISVPAGSEKTFDAIAHEGSHFVGWQGRDTDASSLTLTVDSNISLMAIFEKDEEEVSEEETEEMETETEELETEVQSSEVETETVEETEEEIDSEEESSSEEILEVNKTVAIEETTTENYSSTAIAEEKGTDVVETSDAIEESTSADEVDSAEDEESDDSSSEEPINQDAIAEDDKSSAVMDE